MYRWTCAALGASALLVGAGASEACTPLPNTLNNGTTADANQVMANFNGILSCPNFTNNIVVNGPAPGDVTMSGGLIINADMGTAVEIQRTGTSAFALNPDTNGSWTLYDKATGGWVNSIT
jgi:hypothetical protein